MNDLKPCPICASTAVFLREGNVWKYVECMECDYKSKAVADADIAVQTYNYRPIENDLQVALTEALNVNVEMQRKIRDLRARVEQLQAASYAFLEYVDYSPDPEDDQEEAQDTFNALWIDAECKARAALEDE